MRRLIVAAALLFPTGTAWAAEPFVVHLADVADQKAVIGTVECHFAFLLVLAGDDFESQPGAQ